MNKGKSKDELLRIGRRTQFTSSNQPKSKSISKGMTNYHKERKFKDKLYKALHKEKLIPQMIEVLVSAIEDEAVKPKDKAAIILAIFKLLSPTDKSQSVPSVKVTVNQ